MSLNLVCNILKYILDDLIEHPGTTAETEEPGE